MLILLEPETCPIPSTLLGMTIDNRIRVFVNSLFRWPQRLEPFEAYVDLRNGGKNLSSRRHVSPFGRNDSESTFNVLLFDCPNNRREQSVDESIISMSPFLLLSDVYDGGI